MKDPTNKLPTKRRKVDRKTAIIIDPEYAEKLRKIKGKGESKIQKKAIKPKIVLERKSIIRHLKVVKVKRKLSLKVKVN